MPIWQIFTEWKPGVSSRPSSAIASDFPRLYVPLSQEEFESLRLQIVVSKGKGGRRYLPYVFTEQGVAMLSSVLNSQRAIEVSITIMRVFVRLRQMMATHRALTGKLGELEEHNQKRDEQITDIFKVIRQLIAPPPKPKRKIGFDLKDKQARHGRKMSRQS
jgi:hypothetical protein